MKFEIITKTIITKVFHVEAESEAEARNKLAVTQSPIDYWEDDEEVAWVEEIKENENTRRNF